MGFRQQHFEPQKGSPNLGGAKFPEICGRSESSQAHMSYSRNSLKGGYIGDSIGDYYRGY